MKLAGNFGVDGAIAKEDERYKVIDNTSLNNLVVSSTDLNPGHTTTGHKHAGQEEVYMFIRGTGLMTLTYPDGKVSEFDVSPGDIILIEDDVHHKVSNTDENEQLYFVCVFDGTRSH
ncbi:MAG: cupin domain-containing protein [Pseudomonadota bacterium]|nr:cupin domain-containing protein [Pseudomonadota bacterium]|tara:strand:- start:91 stop:441 length:351 start_codon:yes stop_codon:yes gene_type:complete